ncbi:MAG: class I poly(R)-hydroxyalkanoic acid synthase [Gammaproteobacteria bacterium]|nr:class I poly(R)-hydroxyalkanoic acid synthase [Gammaproteobacteria bacterium]
MSSDNNQKKSDDLQAMSAEFMKIVASNRDAIMDVMKSPKETVTGLLDPFNVAGSFTRAARQLASDPGKLIRANFDLWKKQASLWQHAADRVLGRETQPVAEAPKGDRRFKGKEWEEHLVFDLIRQSYLITSDWMSQVVSGIDGLDEEDAHKVQFHTRQLTNALSPSNFLLTNPEVIRETVASRGKNLVQGMQNLRRDIQAGKGKLNIMMTDPEAFEVGRDVATTPGKVVYENKLIQLIQYAPTTEQVYERPLLIVPPWINKFYILDLRPANSFIRWAVDQGYTVFVVSWANPDESHADLLMDDYMELGILESIDAIEQATGQTAVTTIGYCIGGTLTGATLAYMAAQGDERVKAVTYFTTQFDFTEAGDLKVFIDEKQLENLGRKMSKKGYLEGGDMGTAFNMLRSNDLIWTFYVNNYLMGKEPLDFDLLYWNADSTRMPHKLHMYYLRECYLHNNLAKPGGISLKDVPIDLGKITIPTYIQSSREDHIAPFNSVFKCKNLLGGPVRFMLAGSGHIAGVVNPPSANKYNYWMNENQPEDLEEWLAGAESHPGSWWGDWDAWLSQYSGELVEARQPGDGKLPVLEDAPGSYVKKKS